jgi:hypothetical protein
VNTDTKVEFPLLSSVEEGTLTSLKARVPAGKYSIKITPSRTFDATIVSSHPFNDLEPAGDYYQYSVDAGQGVLWNEDGTNLTITGYNDAVSNFLGSDQFISADAGETKVKTLVRNGVGQETYMGAPITIVTNKQIQITNAVVQDGDEGSNLGYQQGDNSSRDTTMGEIIPSLRLLSRRFTMVDKFTTSRLVLPGITFGTDSSMRQSTTDIISWLYRFTAGSVRFKVIVKDPDTCFVTSVSRDKSDSASGFTPYDSNSAMHIQNTSLNSILEIAQPFYSPAENLAIDSSTFTTDTASLSNLIVGSVFESNNEFAVLKAAGDDHTFTCMVGCPAFYVGALSD